MKRIFNRIVLFFNRLSRRFFYFLASPAKWKFLTFFLASIVLIVILILWKPDYATDILNTAFGFLLGSVGIYFISVLRRSTEDYNKVINDSQFIRNRKYDDNNRISFLFNDIQITDYFDLCYENDGRDIQIIDNKEKMFELDDIIANNYFAIMKSHGSSYKHNEPTVRLDCYDNDNGSLILHTSRSTYFNHLVTNRAIDYFIEGHMTLRDIYEPGPLLTPLEKSKMSNHIGINAFVMLECEGKKYLVLPKRGRTSTISKGLVTSSIASRLIIDNDSVDLSAIEKIPFEKQMRAFVNEKLKLCAYNDPQMKMAFLGFGRNIYEGGKPQFYYLIELPCDKETLNRYSTSNKERKQVEEQLDRDVGLMIIDMSTLKYYKHDAFKASQNIGKRKKDTFFTVEKSFLANLYLYCRKA